MEKATNTRHLPHDKYLQSRSYTGLTGQDYDDEVLRGKGGLSLLFWELLGRSALWFVGCLIGWLVGWLIGWSVDKLVGLLVGW